MHFEMLLKKKVLSIHVKASRKKEHWLNVNLLIMIKATKAQFRK